jgi:hypothetical protein
MTWRTPFTVAASAFKPRPVFVNQAREVVVFLGGKLHRFGDFAGGDFAAGAVNLSFISCRLLGLRAKRTVTRLLMLRSFPFGAGSACGVCSFEGGFDIQHPDILKIEAVGFAFFERLKIEMLLRDVGKYFRLCFWARCRECSLPVSSRMAFSKCLRQPLSALRFSRWLVNRICRCRPTVDEAQVIRKVATETRIEQRASFFGCEVEGFGKKAAGGIPGHRGIVAVADAGSPKAPFFVVGG